MKKKKGLILTVLAIISVIAITIGVTYAFFNYAKEGSTENTISSGTITFLYTETSEVGRGIMLENAYPISDSQGKSLTGEGNVFDFKVTGSNDMNATIPYEITARKSSDSTLPEEAVRIYLTKVNGTEEEVLLDNYSELDQTDKVQQGTHIEKTLYKGKVPANEEDYNQEYRLRMWVDEDVDFSPDKDGNYPYNNKTFTITVNVYANAKVVTDEEIAFENSTKIASLSVDNNNLTSVEGEEYDYETTLPEGTTSAEIVVETENPNATVNIERIDSLAYTSNIKRLSTTKTVDLTSGDNYFKITVTSENKQVTNEYKIKITVSYKQPTAPTITGGSDSWVDTETVIKIENAGVAESGIKLYEYYKSTDSTEPTDSTQATGTTSGELIITDDGTTYIWYRTVSNDEQKSKWSNQEIVKLDTVSPTVIINSNLPNSVTKGDSYTILGSYTANGPSGGSASCSSNLDGTVTNTSQLTTVGNHTITCTAKTGAGKTTTVTKNLKVEYLFLYNWGTDNTAITGGWRQMFTTANEFNFYSTYDAFQMTSTSLHAHVVNHSDSTARSLLSTYTTNKIDLQKFEKIYLTFSGNPDDSNIFISCNIDNSNNVNLFPYLFYRKITNNEQLHGADAKIITLDISSINDSCYLGIVAASGNVNPATNTWFSVDSIYLE